MQKNRRGQMAITMVLSILLFMMLMFPVLNLFVENEGKWSVKEKKSTMAFHLAEAGVDRARWKLLENADFWTITGTGTLSGYNFDQVYTTDVGGTYTVSITSHPTDSDMRVVESAGRDASGTAVRRIKAILRNDGAADFATRAAQGVQNGAGNARVHWGPVMSGTNIDAKNRTYPRFFSAGHVDDQDGGSTTASTDDIYWWSYYPLPPMPKVKFSAYLSSATGSDDLYGGAPNGCGRSTGATYHNSDETVLFRACNDPSGRTYYIDNEAADVSFQSGGAGNFIEGNLIVTNGNLDIKGGGGAKFDYTTPLPPEAWKEYGAAWDTVYRDEFDSGAPGLYSTAVSMNYQAATTYDLENILFHGFVYVGGDFTLSGGGTGRMHGVLMVKGSADLETSTFDIFYDPAVSAGIITDGVNIVMHSWYEVKGEWPDVP